MYVITRFHCISLIASQVRSSDFVDEEDFVETVSRQMQRGQVDTSQDDVELAAFTHASMKRKVNA